MNWHEIGTLVALVGCLLTFARALYTEATRLAKLEVKVDTMWSLMMRRGVSEAVHRGIADVNSPVTITPEAKSWMSELAPQLREFYAQKGKTLSANELALEIEKRWGDEILKKVSIPHNMPQEVCLQIALEVARECA